MTHPFRLLLALAVAVSAWPSAVVAAGPAERKAAADVAAPAGPAAGSAASLPELPASAIATEPSALEAGSADVAAAAPAAAAASASGAATPSVAGAAASAGAAAPQAGAPGQASDDAGIDGAAASAQVAFDGAALRQSPAAYLPNLSSARKRADDSRPTVALVGRITRQAVALARAGARLSPGNVHLVPDPSWIVERDGRRYLTKGIVFDQAGRQPSTVIYDRPQLIRSTDDLAADARPARERVGTSLLQASRELVRGKRLVVVGAGYANKRPFLESMRALGIKVVLVDRAVVDGKPNWAKDLVDEFIDADLVSHPEVGVADAAAKLKDSIAKNGRLDGITTYWEDDVAETARLAQAMGLKFHSVETAEIARSKHRTIDVLTKRGVLKRHTFKIESRAQLEALIAAGKVPAKWFLKPDSGAEAQFTAKYKDGPLLEVYDRLHAKLAQSTDSVYKGNDTFTLTNYLEGNEWDYNVVVQNGKLLDHRPTDNWPTRAHSSKATGSSLPARAMTADERVAARKLTARLVAALGIRDGVLHVEGIGKDLLEVNLRPGGSYTLDWNRRVYGIDEAEMLAMTALGVPAFPIVPAKPLTHLEGAFVFSPLRGVVKRVALSEEGKRLGLHALIEKKPGSVLTDDEDRVAMIFADGASNAEALARLGDDPSRWLDLEVEPAR